MNTPFATIALCACLLGLAACDEPTTSPPAPTPGKPVPADAGVTAGSGGDPSVPSADSVMAPAAAPKLDPAQGRSNNSMSAAQESTAMPMPGQNNDHSAPLGPAKRASAP